MIFNLYKHNRDSRDLISWLTATKYILVEFTSFHCHISLQHLLSLKCSLWPFLCNITTEILSNWHCIDLVEIGSIFHRVYCKWCWRKSTPLREFALKVVASLTVKRIKKCVWKRTNLEGGKHKLADIKGMAPIVVSYIPVVFSDCKNPSIQHL